MPILRARQTGIFAICGAAVVVTASGSSQVSIVGYAEKPTGRFPE